MAKFRKKPVVIEAVQLNSVDINDQMQIDGSLFDESPWWLLNADVEIFRNRESDYAHIAIKTLEGVMTASPGDWIICGVNGEIYPCKPDIFEKTYEAVNE